MALGLGFMSISFGGGYLIPAIGFPGLHLLAAAITVLGAAIFWLYFRVPRGRVPATRLTADEPYWVAECPSLPGGDRRIRRRPQGGRVTRP